MANSKKRKKTVIFSLIGVVLVTLTMAAILKKKEPIVTVQTEKVGRRSLTEIVVANGKIQPVKQVVISPEVAGEIVKLPVKEGDLVKKGDLLVQIKQDNYIASRNSADANYKSATAGKELAVAELQKAEAEYIRNQELFRNKLVSESIFLDFKTMFEVAKLHLQSATHQENQAKFGLDKAMDDLSKTVIQAPMDGTVTRLQSQVGERVLGTSFNKGTEIMTVADLNEMEARVDLGETDVVLIAPGQSARLEVDAFRDRRFSGAVTEIANSAKGLGSSTLGMGGGGSSSSQDATKFEVRIRIAEKEVLRPGMSVTAEIETRSRSNVITVPFMSVTTRPPKIATNLPPTQVRASETNAPGLDKKSKDSNKHIEVVFVTDGDRVKMVPVKIGISDENYYEVITGLEEGQEVISGTYRAIKDLEDGKRIVRGSAETETGKKAM